MNQAIARSPSPYRDRLLVFSRVYGEVVQQLHQQRVVGEVNAFHQLPKTVIGKDEGAASIDGRTW